jgi:hypothetical protein
MEAIPLPPLIEGDEEQVGTLRVAEHLLTVVAPCHGVTQRACESVEERSVQQEELDGRGLASENLFGEIVDDMAVTARELTQELLHVRSSPQGKCRQLQASDPSLGAILEHGISARGDDQVQVSGSVFHEIGHRLVERFDCDDMVIIEREDKVPRSLLVQIVVLGLQ